MIKKNPTRILQLSICGALHSSKNLPCQDYAYFRRKGKKIVAVVSDGAGSAKFGKFGAKIIAETVCNTLLKCGINNVKQAIENAIYIARDKVVFHRLNQSQSESGLSDFSATLVGFFYDGRKGVFFHIGDGAALAFLDKDNKNIAISEPENGAFPCETYFFTMPDWKNNLRFTEFSNAEKLVLMTDGVTGFVFDDFGQIRENFLFPIMRYLDDEPRKTYALKALENTLGSTKAMRINSDDKTILWVKLK
jgi:serine/threonine protein phosphatase PrpC